MRAKRVLIVTYYWPPASGGPVWRFLKFSKYLSHYGWTPVILTVKNPSYSTLDESLVDTIPSDIKVYKAFSLDPFRLYNLLIGKKGKSIPEAMSGIRESKNPFHLFAKFIRANIFVPDPRIGWKRYAVRKAAKIIKEHNIQVIITTSPPNSTHMIGLALKKRFNLPWIMDFRDPWSTSYFNKEFLNRLSVIANIDRKLEIRCLKNADQVIGISKGISPLIEEFNIGYQTIYNGYDEEDFQDRPENKLTTKKFVVTFLGSLKPNMNIRAIWQSFSELTRSNSKFKDSLELRFIGNHNQQIISEIKKLGLENNLNMIGFVNHDRAIQYLYESTALLFIVPRAKNNLNITSGKIFEYMASRTPIIPVGPKNGEAENVLKMGTGQEIIDYEDQPRIFALIQQYFDTWINNEGCIPYRSVNDFSIFSRKKLTGQLADILDRYADSQEDEQSNNGLTHSPN